MKKQIFAMAFIALGFGTTLVSCTKDEVKEESKGIVTDNLSLSLTTKDENSTMGKSVNRGDLKVWIKDIVIKATSKDFVNYSKELTFDLVDGTAKTNTFDMDGVAVGHNLVEVSTTTSTLPIYDYDYTVGSPIENLLEKLKNQNPYAIYTATIEDVNVVKGVVNVIPQTLLKTKHGRSISFFKMSEKMVALGSYAIVTPVISSPSEKVGSTQKTFSVDALQGQVSSVVWSNSKSVAGNSLTFNVKLYNANGVEVNSFIQVVTIQASKSLNQVFTINDNEITTQNTSQTFTAEDWINVDLNGATIGN